jgi:hypothetical protein
LSLILALFLMACAGITIFAEDFVANFSLFPPTKPPTLAESLQNATTTSAGSASAFLKTGKSGVLNGTNWPDSHWTNPKGGQVPIAISWTRNPKGILVTASPAGPVPKGQDGTPKTQQVLTNGMFEFSLDYFEQQGKKMQSSSHDFFSNDFNFDFSTEMFQLNDLVQASAKPIIDYAKGHDGELPEEAEGASLLSTVKKVFEFNPDTTSTATDQSEIRFEITKYTYHPLPDGMFSIDYDWEYSQPNNPRMGNPDFKATGTFTMQYSAKGMIVMQAEKNDGPLDEIMKAIDIQGE